MKTNEGLVGANGKQNKLDGVMFLDLTLGLRTHQVTCLFLFPETCKEPRIHCSERPREAPTCTAPAHPPRSTNDAPAPRTGLYDAPPLPQHLRCPSPLRQPLEPPPHQWRPRPSGTTQWRPRTNLRHPQWRSQEGTFVNFINFKLTSEVVTTP